MIGKKQKGSDNMRIQVVLSHGEDGYIVARCPSLKSCWSQGKTKAEAIQNIREAIELYLEPDAEKPEAFQYEEVVELTV